MSRIARLRSKLHKRLRRRDRQISFWKKDHKRGHAKEAKKDAHAVRFLRHLLGIKIRRREEERKHDGPTVMYDSVTVSEIPAKAKAVAGYVGGFWPTYFELEGKHEHVLSIAVNASEDAECLDIETGDATPSEAHAWVTRQKARGVKRPVVYASASVMPEVLANLSGYKRGDYRIWTAHYDGKHICGPGTCRYISVDADATQWTSTSHGRNLDESYLRKDFFA